MAKLRSRVVLLYPLNMIELPYSCSWLPSKGCLEQIDSKQQCLFLITVCTLLHVFQMSRNKQPMHPAGRIPTCVNLQNT
jgi:hypothetical protein